VHPGTITPGDQSLEVEAYSPEGIASIKIIANGNQVVAEKTCESGSKCTTLEKTLNTETENWPPGILWLEVVVTETNELVSSRRFWDNIPYVPPAANPEIEAPTFEKVQKFREEFGLDLDLHGVPHEERAIDERIHNLIHAWHEPGTAAGQVAQASSERWGVPLRAVDVAELEYRERYAAEAAKLIPRWAEEHAQSSYAGYYINQRQGGLIYVGFTSNQASLVGQLDGELGELPTSRIRGFSVQPQNSFPELATTLHEISAALKESPGLEAAFVSQGLDLAANVVDVETSSPTSTKAFLEEHFGIGKFEVTFASHRVMADREALTIGPKRTREADNRLFGGDALVGYQGAQAFDCTLGWGAREPVGESPFHEVEYERLGLTAGHCFDVGSRVFRWAQLFGKKAEFQGEGVEFQIGTVGRRGYDEANSEGFEVDAEAFTLADGYLPPRWIWANPGVQLRLTAPPEVPYIGETVCHSGINGGYTCAPVQEFREIHYADETNEESTLYPTWEWYAPLNGIPGDSGGPVWNVMDNAPLGMESAGGGYFTPLLESRKEEDGVLVGRSEGAQERLSHGYFEGRPLEIVTR
jgi:hypothetical protein